MDEHPFATYFDVEQGYRELTHSHMCKHDYQTPASGDRNTKQNLRNGKLFFLCLCGPRGNELENTKHHPWFPSARICPLTPQVLAFSVGDPNREGWEGCGTPVGATDFRELPRLDSCQSNWDLFHGNFNAKSMLWGK